MKIWILFWMVFVHKNCTLPDCKSSLNHIQDARVMNQEYDFEKNAVVHCYQNFQTFTSSAIAMTVYETLETDSRNSARLFLADEWMVRQIPSPKFEVKEK